MYVHVYWMNFNPKSPSISCDFYVLLYWTVDSYLLDFAILTTKSSIEQPTMISSLYPLVLHSLLSPNEDYF